MEQVTFSHEVLVLGEVASQQEQEIAFLLFQFKLLKIIGGCCLELSQIWMGAL